MISRNKSAFRLIRFAGTRFFSTSQPKSQTSGSERLSFESLQTKAPVLTEKYRAITIFSLNRPDKKNALDKSMLRELTKAISTFDRDAEASVGILCGVGGNFSVGYDMDELTTAIQDNGNILENITFEQNLTTKPMICCISGYCMSLALELALMCDIRIVEESAVMQFSNRQLGIPLVNGGPQRLSQLVGASRAADLLLTNRELKAKEAHEIGLASYVAMDGSCLGRALSIASYMSSFPQSSLKYDKRNLYSALTSSTSGKVDAIPPNVLDDLRAGLEFEHSEKKFTYVGSKRATRHFKVEKMAAWEQDEYARELEYMNKKSANGSPEKEKEYKESDTSQIFTLLIKV